ncbi:MAG: LD-carboxypeptidase [archaeon]
MKTAFLISPSGHSSKKELKNSLILLKKLDWKVKYLQSINDKFYYYAGDYKRRANEINTAYKDKESEIIFCIRGGMGAVHTLDFLDYETIKRSGKILVGMSDITILLNTIYQKTGQRCLHGPNLKKSLGTFNKKTISCLFDNINKRNFTVKYKNKDIFKEGYVKGDIIGGNISLLERSLGTKYEINTDNKILFLEEYDMRDRLIYDILWQLKLAGKFNNVKGIILGYFTKCGKDITPYIHDFFKNFNCPIIQNQPIGHEEPNLTIPLGEICIIDTSKKEWKIIFKK